MLESTDEIETVYTNYRFEIKRLESFKSWPADKSFIQQLASSGFYYTGHGDKVKCFDCHVSIAGWKKGIRKEPLQEHKRFFPRCRFVRMIPCGDVPIGVDPSTVPKRVPKMREIRELDPSKLNLNKVITIYIEEGEIFTRVRIGDLIGAKFPYFSYYESRLKSYLHWPALPKKEDMAAAGLICKNIGDKVLCFYCGGGLQDWKPHDDPIKEHITWFPDCKFINRILKEKQTQS